MYCNHQYQKSLIAMNVFSSTGPFKNDCQQLRQTCLTLSPQVTMVHQILLGYRCLRMGASPVITCTEYETGAPATNNNRLHISGQRICAGHDSKKSLKKTLCQSFVLLRTLLTVINSLISSFRKKTVQDELVRD